MFYAQIRITTTEKVMFGDKPAAAICATAISQTAKRFRTAARYKTANRSVPLDLLYR